LKFLKKLESGITKANDITAVIASFFIIPMIVVVIAEVVIRNAFMHHLNLAIDVSWILFVIFSFLGVGYALAKNIHIKVDFFYNLLKRRGKIIVNLIGYPILVFLPLFSLVFSMYVLTIDAIVNDLPAFLTPWEYPLWPIRLLICVGMVLMTLQAGVKLAERIREIRGMKSEHDREIPDTKEGEA